MPTSHEYDPKHWRDRAENWRDRVVKMRLLANGMRTEQLAGLMLDLADDYDEMAARAGNRTKPSA